MDDITRLREHLTRRDARVSTHWDGCIDSHPICALAWALDEVEWLTQERNRWQATAAGLLEDIGNAEDELEALREKVQDLSMRSEQDVCTYELLHQELADWQRTVRAHEEESGRLRARADDLERENEFLRRQEASRG